MKRFFYILIVLSISFSQEEYIAIMTLDGIGLTDEEASILTERLTNKMIELKKYTIIERSNVDKIMNEQKFQYSGCTDTQCAVEIGKMLNSNYILIGSVSKLGQTYSMDCRIIDVETSEALTSASYTIKGTIDMLFNGADNIAMQLCDLEPAQQPKVIKNDNKVSGDGLVDKKQTNKTGFYVSYDISAAYLIDTSWGETIFDADYDSGAITVGYESVALNWEGGISYDLVALSYEGEIDGDRFLNIYTKYNFRNSFSKSWWWWLSGGYNFPLSDLANDDDLWYEPWEGTFCWSFGFEGKNGLGVGAFYNYSTLTGSDGTEFNNMVYRISAYYSF